MSYAIAQERIVQAQAEGSTELDLAGLEGLELEEIPWSCDRASGLSDLDNLSGKR